MKNLVKYLSPFLVASLIFVFTACKQEGQMEKAGKKADEAIENVEKKVEEAAEAVKEKTE
jgi:hypothetical protein